MPASKVDASATETSSVLVDEMIYNAAAMVDTSRPRVGGDSESSCISHGADSRGEVEHSPLSRHGADGWAGWSRVSKWSGVLEEPSICILVYYTVHLCLSVRTISLHQD